MGPTTLKIERALKKKKKEHLLVEKYILVNLAKWAMMICSVISSVPIKPVDK